MSVGFGPVFGELISVRVNIGSGSFRFSVNAGWVWLDFDGLISVRVNIVEFWIVSVDSVRV